MKRCSIFIHSQDGNNFIIGNAFKDELEKHEFEVRFYRVEDNSLHILANTNEMVNQYYEEINSLPIGSLSAIEKSDLVLLGSPVLFGNVTAQMKMFMDTALPDVESKIFSAKHFACFVSGQERPDNCIRALESMICWGSELSMIHIPFTGEPKQGLIHFSGRDGKIRPSEELGKQIIEYVRIFKKALYQ